jgi:hypothetical protein
MSIFDDIDGEESARVAHQNALKHSAAQAAAQQARWQAGQKAAGQAEKAKRPEWARSSEPTASALALAEQLTPEYRSDKVKARRRAEVRATAAAIYRAEHPPTRDPRTSAEKLAEGAGQSRL